MEDTVMAVKKALAIQVSDARVMADGIKSRLESVSRVGLTEAKAESLTALSDEIDALNSKQEELKALLKNQTAQIEAKLSTLATEYAEAKKLVKISVEQNDWKTFGINDKR